MRLNLFKRGTEQGDPTEMVKGEWEFSELDFKIKNIDGSAITNTLITENLSDVFNNPGSVDEAGYSIAL